MKAFGIEFTKETSICKQGGILKIRKTNIDLCAVERDFAIFVNTFVYLLLGKIWKMFWDFLGVKFVKGKLFRFYFLWWKIARKIWDNLWVIASELSKNVFRDLRMKKSSKEQTFFLMTIFVFFCVVLSSSVGCDFQSQRRFKMKKEKLSSESDKNNLNNNFVRLMLRQTWKNCFTR